MKRRKRSDRERENGRDLGKEHGRYREKAGYGKGGKEKKKCASDYDTQMEETVKEEEDTCEKRMQT